MFLRYLYIVPATDSERFKFFFRIGKTRRDRCEQTIYSRGDPLPKRIFSKHLVCIDEKKYLKKPAIK